MASWDTGLNWTPHAADDLANLLEKHGAVGLLTVEKLRKSAARKNPSNILGVRAQHAYEEAVGDLGEPERTDCVADVRELLRRIAT